MTKASPQAVTAVLLLGTRGPERAEGDGRTKRGGWCVRRGETLGFFSTSLSCFKRKKEERRKRKTSKRNTISGQRKRRAYKRQIETRKGRK